MENDYFMKKNFGLTKSLHQFLLIGNVDYIEKNPSTIRDFLHAHHDETIWINQNPEETRNVFNNFLDSYFGQSLSDEML